MLVVDPDCADVALLAALTVLPTPACAAAMTAWPAVICCVSAAACCLFVAAWLRRFCLACAGVCFCCPAGAGLAGAFAGAAFAAGLAAVCPPPDPN